MFFVYIILAFIATIALGLVIIMLSDRVSNAFLKILARGKAAVKGEDLGVDPMVLQRVKGEVFETISKVVTSRNSCRELTEAISNIINEEADKTVKLKNEKLIKQYDSIIKEKEESERIAHEKYNTALSAKKNTEAVIRSIAEGLVVVDANGNVVMMNPTAEKLLGISKEDKVGKPILEDIKKEQLVSLMTNKSSKGGTEIEVAGSEDETKKTIRSSSAVIENENGQTVGVVSVLSDITKQKELNQLKSDFVSKVSHELRTPIITIENAVSLLLGKSIGKVTTEQKELLEISKRSLDRLGLLVNDLLDEAKLEASKVKLNLTPTSIEKLTSDACETLNAWAMTKAIRIEKKIQKGIPEINLDYNRMIQVLNNIIGNAIKFTPREGAITIEAIAEDNNKYVLISVSDTGPGIAEKDLDRIFDKFYQGGERALTDISGTGLGLSITKEIVLLHKGKIWAESDGQRGAKFSFLLPTT